MLSSWRQSRVLLQAAGAASAMVLMGKRRAVRNEASASIDRDPSPFGDLSPSSPIYVFRPNPNLEIAFDSRSRNPVYVMERLSPSSSSSPEASSLKRPNHFYEEKSLPEEFRSRPSHYKGSGLDRGHMAAAVNYMRGTPKELADTFNLTNVSPQNHSMNASIWARLERWTLTVAQQHPHADTYVVSGPLWLPARQMGERLFEYQHSAIGTPPCLVSVPTHFWKVVVAVDKSGNNLLKFACFVVPNTDFDKRDGSRGPSLEDFLVPWTSLESVTGLHFFPALTKDPEWKETANLLTNELTKARQPNERLMLTDGSPSNRRNKWTGKSMTITHFCANGGCR